MNDVEIIISILIGFILLLIILLSNLDNIRWRIYRNPHWVIFLDKNRIVLKDVDKGKFKHNGLDYLYDNSAALTYHSDIIICDSKKAINIPLDKNTPASDEHTAFYHQKVFEQLMLILHGTELTLMKILIIIGIVVNIIVLIKVYGVIK